MKSDRWLTEFAKFSNKLIKNWISSKGGNTINSIKWVSEYLLTLFTEVFHIKIKSIILSNKKYNPTTLKMYPSID